MAPRETEQKAVLLTALLNGPKPSDGLAALRSSGRLDAWYPELQGLVGVAQSPLHHPEGDVWTHTMLVVDYASTIKAQAQNPACFLLAALCHDLGKPATTTTDDRGQIHAYGHDEVGAGVARLSDPHRHGRGTNQVCGEHGGAPYAAQSKGEG